MELNNKPFVPPTCPTDQYGAPIILSPDQFVFCVYDAKTPRPETGIFGHFTELGSVTEDNDDGNLVETYSAEAPLNSDIARQAHEIYSNEEATRRMGARFCERVINCRGVVDGECWALGARAVIEVVREVSEA